MRKEKTERLVSVSNSTSSSTQAGTSDSLAVVVGDLITIPPINRVTWDSQYKLDLPLFSSAIPSSRSHPFSTAEGGAGGTVVSPSHRGREGHGFESHWSPQQ